MKPLARPIPRPSPPRTKILVVRSAGGGVKSVRRSDEADRTPLRLAIGVIVAVGVVAVVWLMGYMGFRLGFAPLVRTPQLLGEPGRGLATGVIMLVSIPKVIIFAGIAKPTWLMLGFVLITIPAAGLSAARPRIPGGPEPTPAGAVFSYAGAVGAAVNAFIVIWWTASATRNNRIGELPFDPAALVTDATGAQTDTVTAWLGNLRMIAGLDVLAVVAATVWVVLVMRLAIPLWLRSITAAASLFALVVVIVAMSMSNAAAAQIQTFRSVVFIDDGSIDTRLLLGYTERHVATLRIDHDITIVELHDRSSLMTVIGRQSIVGMLEEHTAKNRKR